MKKQVFSLMLSAAIFTTTPVFSMVIGMDIELESTGIPVSFTKNPDNSIDVITDNNADASYQAISKRFPVIPGQTIKVDYDVEISQGVMSFGLLATSRTAWYDPEVILRTGKYQNSFMRIVPKNETETTLVLRNYHLGVGGQTTFKLNKLQMSIVSAADDLSQPKSESNQIEPYTGTVFGSISEDITLEIISPLPFNDLLSVLSTSKPLSWLRQKPAFWGAINKNLSSPCDFVHKPCLFWTTEELLAPCYNQYFSNLFSELDKNYTVKVSQLLAFLQVENPNFQKTEGSIVDASYNIVRANKQYRMDVCDVHSRSRESLNLLQLLDKHALVTFLSPNVENVWRKNEPAYRGAQSFGAFLMICNTLKGIKALSPEVYPAHDSPEILGELHFLIKQL